MQFFRRKSTWLLIAILSLGVFFRSFHFAESFIFEHDQDLYSWIAKDIVDNHHQRLIGQVTSVDGVFIGPLFYYLVAILYVLTNLNPLSVVAISVGVGMLTAVSVFYCFKTFFNQETALIGALLTSVSLGFAMYDRWIVPTEPSILWSIWLLYVTLSLFKGRLKVLPILGVLMGLIWHIHIALLPLLLLPPLAYFLSRDKALFNLKKSWPLLAVTIIVFFIVSSPFWLFELKHQFGQTRALFVGSQIEVGEVTGGDRLLKITGFISKNLVGTFAYPFLGNVPMLAVYGIFLVSWILLDRQKILGRKYSLLLGLWLGSIVAFHFFTKRNLSEYYLTNTIVPFLVILSLSLNWLYKRVPVLTVILLVWYVSLNLGWLNSSSISETAYIQKKALVDYIQADAAARQFPCMHINYIANFGTNVGFRFLFWKDNLHLINTTSDVPSYDIVIPWQVSQSEEAAHFGRFGLITPKGDYTVSKATCADPKNQLLPLLGYND